jgi:hypothetical protein
VATVRRAPASNSEVAALLAWSEDFEAGMFNDPALIEGTLTPGELVAVRAALMTAATLDVQRDGAVVTGVGVTGAMLATNQRVLLQPPGGERVAWSWTDDVGQVTPLRNFLGAMWSPSETRYRTGVRLEGLVLPEFARGETPLPVADAGLRSVWIKVQVAWRASQPGGVRAWRTEFRRRYWR